MTFLPPSSWLIRRYRPQAYNAIHAGSILQSFYSQLAGKIGSWQLLVINSGLVYAEGRRKKK
ncbi:hypothetical protein [Nostoc sp. ChiVER01]|uniref:hypothetical protein n=1 Tax=Nostoc sp. ChiVER01 TaxID=3075382 RepID=UPI002AD59B8D|nr:hypothetical protein [Nostoc sp. ChiVER01]MDZ8225081.1 hypothetical protein [Nostoc sp. ChiVER01]